MSLGSFLSSDTCVNRFSVDISYGIDIPPTSSGGKKHNRLKVIEDDNEVKRWCNLLDGEDEINGEEEYENCKESIEKPQPFLFYPHEMQEFIVTFPLSMSSKMAASSTRFDGQRDENKSFGIKNAQGDNDGNETSSMSLNLLQAWSSIDDSGADDTGLVLRGASVTLSQFLMSQHERYFVEESKVSNNGSLPSEQEWRYGQGICLESRPLVKIHGRTVLELGCGIALPSLVTCRLGAARVIASDFREATLAHVLYQAEQNKCLSAYFEEASLDWESHLVDRSHDTKKYSTTENERYANFNVDSGAKISGNEIGSVEVDIIVAADVICGLSLVPALVATIDAHLRHIDSKVTENMSLPQPVPPPPQVVVATRHGRRGITEFRKLITSPPYNFVEVFAQSYDNQRDAPTIPMNLQQDELSSSRWYGRHSINIYQRA